MELCRIILVDDHSLFRSGMRGLLDRYDGIRVVGEASTGEEFLAMLPATEADVVFLDFAMPGMNGAETTEKALALEPGLKVITLSMFGDENYYSRMVQAGAKGFLMKDSPELCHHIMGGKALFFIYINDAVNHGFLTAPLLIGSGY